MRGRMRVNQPFHSLECFYHSTSPLVICSHLPVLLFLRALPVFLYSYCTTLDFNHEMGTKNSIHDFYAICNGILTVRTATVLSTAPPKVKTIQSPITYFYHFINYNTSIHLSIYFSPSTVSEKFSSVQPTPTDQISQLMAQIKPNYKLTTYMFCHLAFIDGCLHCLLSVSTANLISYN